MATSLTNFRVVNLHGRRTWDVAIKDNRLVLVGENGTGKSTFATLVYYFLTSQWRRIRSYRFDSIYAVLNGEEIRITHELVDALWQRGRLARFSRLLQPQQLSLWFQGLRGRRSIDLLSNEASLRSFANEVGVPPRIARDLLLHDPHAEQEHEHEPELVKISETISSLVTEQILFLPTYRRIEQELQSIFPGSDEEIQAIRRRLASSRTGESFIELVEFGMEDVEKTIGARLDQIKEGVRTALNNLTGIYLRDVIRGVSHIDIEQLRNIDRSVLEDILIRIGEDILPASDKHRLTERVEKMAERSQLEAEDTAVAHFLLKLLALYKEQQEKERDVREFVEVCNGYLSGKQLVYDNKGYTIVIQPTKGWEEPPGSGEQALQFRMLSSGEKQIVSLFSHIYLSGRKGFFVIIDEPELSLSVPWQRRFLPDILKTNECTGLIAATHSPFIWENELEPYTKSLAEFVEGSGVVRR